MFHPPSCFSPSLLLAVLVAAAAVLATTTAAAAADSQQQLQQLRQKRASSFGSRNSYAAHMPLPYKRNPRPLAAAEPDPALQGMSMDELYRMVELLDLVKAGREDKMSKEEVKLLEFLLSQYEQ